MKHVFYLFLLVPMLAFAAGVPGPGSSDNGSTGVCATPEGLSVLNQRERMIDFVNRADLDADGDGIGEITIGQDLSMTISYATQIDSNGMEDELQQVAVRISELDSAGATVNQSVFNGSLVVTNGGPNTDTAMVNYTVAMNYIGDIAIPLTADLPEGHTHTLRVILVSNNADGAGRNFLEDSGRVNIVAEGGGEMTGRARLIDFVNRDDLDTDGDGIGEIRIGEELSMTIAYATQIDMAGMEDSLQQIAVRISEVDAAGMKVNESVFAGSLVVLAGSPAADTAMVTYTVAMDYIVGGAIPLTADLPEGHTHNLRVILVSVNANGVGRNFLEDRGQVNIVADDGGGEMTSRDRLIDFVNRDDLDTDGDGIGEIRLGEELEMTIAYATQIDMAGMEDSLQQVAVRISELDAAGATVNQSIFDGSLVVLAGEPNSDTTMVTYTVATEYLSGAQIPLTTDLPEGHTHSLRVILVSNNANGVGRNFTEDVGRVNIVGTVMDTLADREEFVTWVNAADFIAAGETTPAFTTGDVLNIEVAYATLIANGVASDLNYLAVELQQLSDDVTVVSRTAFTTIVGAEGDNTDTLSFEYVIPEMFTDETDINATIDLPEGGSYRLAIFAEVKDAADTTALRYPNANTEIVIQRPVATDAEINRQLLGIFPNPTSGDLRLKTGGELRNLSVRVFDLMGRNVIDRHYDLLPSNATIRTAGLPAGTYVLRLTDGEGRVARRFIKE